MGESYDDSNCAIDLFALNGPDTDQHDDESDRDEKHCEGVLWFDEVDVHQVILNNECDQEVE